MVLVEYATICFSLFPVATNVNNVN